ncbi:hypothetical protein R2362_03170 [Mycobacteroides chelonae]|nr:hypothetical protein [Mycobacteroides chelonae]
MDEFLHLDAEEMRRAASRLGVFLDDAAQRRKFYEAEMVLREVLQSVNNYRVMKGTE